jgi:hypothetical protein
VEKIRGRCKEKIKIPCSTAVANYACSRGVVDLSDQLCEYYGAGISSKNFFIFRCSLHFSLSEEYFMGLFCQSVTCFNPRDHAAIYEWSYELCVLPITQEWLNGFSWHLVWRYATGSQSKHINCAKVVRREDESPWRHHYPRSSTMNDDVTIHDIITCDEEIAHDGVISRKHITWEWPDRFQEIWDVHYATAGQTHIFQVSIICNTNMTDAQTCVVEWWSSVITSLPIMELYMLRSLSGHTHYLILYPSAVA